MRVWARRKSLGTGGLYLTSPPMARPVGEKQTGQRVCRSCGYHVCSCPLASLVESALREISKHPGMRSQMLHGLWPYPSEAHGYQVRVAGEDPGPGPILINPSPQIHGPSAYSPLWVPTSMALNSDAEVVDA